MCCSVASAVSAGVRDTWASPGARPTAARVPLASESLRTHLCWRETRFSCAGELIVFHKTLNFQLKKAATSHMGTTDTPQPFYLGSICSHLALPYGQMFKATRGHILSKLLGKTQRDKSRSLIWPEEEASLSHENLVRLLRSPRLNAQVFSRPFLVPLVCL